jgi:hypothetical protein
VAGGLWRAAFLLRRQNAADVNLATSRRTSLTCDKGFAIALQPDTDLGLAMPIAEDEEGRNQPVSVVSTIREAVEFAKSDFTERMCGLQSGKREAFARHSTSIGPQARDRARGGAGLLEHAGCRSHGLDS